ncbi:hypothetical protein ASD8599_03493 [Ascidiaceihabitans donghaensis]|uniref:Uncharacterized protein n=1 Tax=Ascidiaceihabitans donghaensis TaxID=1510460 RepID=A0A2R8BHY9_9RHOB|nr:hypothetical protein [Ascidiaceihabitans donghaensis]SPH22745.1 hypothetical protein ASD8599_03493 [Ascidiaceihabitans donghaensis]
MNKSGTDNLKKWLQRALWFVPIAYFVNFVYAIFSNQTGGTFGDTFGAANALFSGTALLMLVYAIILQREELEVVKEERNDTKTLLRGQEKINTQQGIALRKQSFEQSFFAVLRLISEEKKALDRTITDGTNQTIKFKAGNNAQTAIKSLVENDKTQSRLSVSNHIANCCSVCRLFTTAFYMISQSNFLTKHETLNYGSSLHALLDADLAQVWCLYSILWEEKDPRAAHAFISSQGIDFIDESIQDEVRERLKNALNNFTIMESEIVSD